MPSYALIVEDEPGLATALERVYRDYFTTVIIVHTGEEAIALLRDPAIDFLFLSVDLHLPVLQGYDVIEFARAHGCRAVIFVLTAVVNAESVSKKFDFHAELLPKLRFVDKDGSFDRLRTEILEHVPLVVDVDDPRFLEQVEALSRVEIIMLLGLVNRRPKEDLLRRIDLTKEAWHQHIHRILDRMDVANDCRGGPIEKLADRVRARVFSQRRERR